MAEPIEREKCVRKPLRKIPAKPVGPVREPETYVGSPFGIPVHGYDHPGVE